MDSRLWGCTDESQAGTDGPRGPGSMPDTWTLPTCVHSASSAARALRAHGGWPLRDTTSSFCPQQTLHRRSEVGAGEQKMGSC